MAEQTPTQYSISQFPTEATENNANDLYEVSVPDGAGFISKKKKHSTLTAGLATEAALAGKADVSAIPDALTDLDTTVTGAQLNALKTKVDGVAAGATANDTDANLKNRANHTGTQSASTISDFNTAADARITAQKGQNNGLASLDSGGKVPSSQLPSYVDDVLEYANTGAFPATGTAGLIYVALDTNKVYRWGGSSYIEISPSPGSTDAVPEGSSNLYFTTGRASAAAPVQSVAGKTGTVTLAKGDVGLGNVPNVDATARSSHTGTQVASTISDFQATVSANTDVAANTTARHTHSNKAVLDATTASFLSADRTKLDGVESAADVTDAGNVGSAIAGATAKTTPVDADTLGLIDSAASNVLKKVSWTNVKATLKTYFDTLYAAVSHTHSSSQITDFDEAVEDKIGNKVKAGSNVTVSYDDTTGDTTISATGGGGGGASNWGDLGGTLADQTDLQAALDAKADDASVVHDTGSETIAGTKTFTDGVVTQGNLQTRGIVQHVTSDGSTLMTLNTEAAVEDSTFELAAAVRLLLTRFIINEDMASEAVSDGGTSKLRHYGGLLQVSNSGAAFANVATEDYVGGVVPTNTSDLTNDSGFITSAPVTSVNTRTGAVTGLAEASDLTSHTGNTSNPHSVTKTQVGLGSVTNDAQLKVADLDTDSTMAANSDTKIPSQKAVKTALGGKVGTSTTVAGTALSGNVTQDQITGLSSTGLIKRTGTNTLAVATAGTDYLAFSGLAKITVSSSAPSSPSTGDVWIDTSV